MAPSDSRQKWEQRLLDTCEPWNGWGISRVRDRVVVRYRAKGSAAESVTLPRPLTWDQQHHRDAIRWIEALYRAWDDGSKSLKAALGEISGKSDKGGPERAVTWGEIADALQASRTQDSKKCSVATFTKNWRPFVDEAVRLIEAGKAHDGYSLLKAALRKWKDAPSMRVECGRYLGIFTAFAVARHGAARTWAITDFDKSELIPARPKPRLKAVLEDSELLRLIELADGVNPRWGNVFRLLAQFGLRPCELSHLSPRVHPVTGRQAIWCSYSKTGGREQTDPRFLQSMYLRDSSDQPVQWGLEQALADGTLELPTGRDGDLRKLNGSGLNTYLHRVSRSTGEPSGPVQSYWAELVAKYAAKTPAEWLRPYSFRDSFSIRCHREGVALNSICASMGHSPAVHHRSYRTITDAIISRDFAAEPAALALPQTQPLAV